MFRFIEQILDGFRPCFSRRAAFRWFVVVIVGLMLRSDRLGVTSIIRDLALDPSGYESLIHFFRSTAWDADAAGQLFHYAILACYGLGEVELHFSCLYSEGIALLEFL